MVLSMRVYFLESLFSKRLYHLLDHLEKTQIRLAAFPPDTLPGRRTQMHTP